MADFGSSGRSNENDKGIGITNDGDFTAGIDGLAFSATATISENSGKFTGSIGPFNGAVHASRTDATYSYGGKLGLGKKGKVGDFSYNLGAFFTFWDRLFGTYVDQPKAGLRDLVMGLPSSECPQRFTVAALLLHPFRRRN